MSETIDQQDYTDEALEPRALIEAVEQRNEDEVKRLIDAGVPVDGTDNRGKNALVEAVRRNKTLVRLLVEQGKAFVDSRDVYGRTPLFYAITKSKRIAKYLIEKGADVNLKDFSNRSLLSFFVENCMTNENISLSSLMSAKNHEVQMLTDPSKDVGHDMINTVLSIIFCKLPLICAYQTESDMWTKPSTAKTRLVNQKTIETTWKNFIPVLSEARKHFAEKDTEKEAILGEILKKCEENKPFSTMCNSVIELLVKIGANPNFADSDGNTALHFAACLPWMGVSQETIKKICTNLHRFGVPLNAKNNLGQTPLLFCLSGSMEHLEEEDKVTAVKALVEVCKFLITRGSSLKETTQDGETVFHLVIKLFQQGLQIPIQKISKDVLHETMNILHCFSCDRLNEKTTVNKRDAHLNSPLHYWAKLTLPQDPDYVGSDLLGKTLEEILELLINVGASLNPRNEDEETPLHLCKTWNAVNLLADKGANLNDVDSSGRSPMLAAMTNQTNRIKPSIYQCNMVREFIVAGADVHIRDNKGKTVLFHAVDKHVVRALVDSGTNVNRTDNEGKTALFCAVQIRNNESVVRALVDVGAYVNSTDNEGKTALFYAVQIRNNESVVRALVDAGAYVDRTDNGRKTALFYAVQEENNESVVRALVDASADVNITDDEGKTALFYAVQEWNNESVLRSLVDRGADVNITDNEGKTALFYAVQERNNESVLRSLVDYGADVNRTDNEGKTALFYAVQEWNNESMLRSLVDAGANVNRTDNEGKTALIYAVQEWNNESVVRSLVDGGADVNITDKEGKTALFYAVQIGNSERVVHALVDCGADVNRSDNQGKTALFYVVQQSVADLLIDAGAVFDARDHYGRSPLFYAMTKSDLLTTYLLDRGANLYLKDSCSVLTFLVERLYEIPFQIHERIQILLKNKKVSKEQILKAISSVVFNKILSFNPISYDFDRDPLLELLRVAKHYTTLVDVGQRKAIEKISKRIRDKALLQSMEALLHPETMRIILRNLLKLGASPNSVDSGGNSGLHHVIQLSWRGVPEEDVLYICNQLKEMGASLHIRNHQKETPVLHCLVSTIKEISNGSSYQWSEVKTQLSLCQFLIEHGSDVEEETQNGQSALHLILELLRQVLLHKELRNGGLEDLMRLFSAMLNAYKGKKESKDNNGNTPLHLWAKLALPPAEDYSITTAEGYTFRGLLSKILNHFKESKVSDVNGTNNDGKTPLHVCRTWTAVELLLDAGANPNHIDSSGRTPLVVAAENHKSFLIPGHFYPDVLQEPKAFWKTAALEKGLDPWTVDNQGKSVMGSLLEEESFDLAQGMIEFACEDNSPGCAQHLFTLLCAVCKDKSNSAQTKTDLVRIILESQKCPLYGRAREDSPLHFCCRNIVKNPIDDNVHWAIAKKLLLYEANCKTLDTTGKSCLDIAEECPKLKELLLKPIDINDIPLKIKTWRPISKVHKEKMVYVARGRRSIHVKPYWYHRQDLARGAFGTVFAGINEKDGREVAIKRIEKIRMNRPEDKREIGNLATLADCEQVVRYLVFFEDDYFSYMVLELMEGHLDQILDSTLSMDTKVSLCQDVVKGLRFLHEHHILHRDLKPTNILYKTHPKLCLKIADFGLSRRMDITLTTVYGTNAGTRCWIAPEVLTATKYQHSTASDMFSCGLVLHYILSAKKHPFSPEDCANKSEFQIRNEAERNMIDSNKEGWDDSLSPEAANLLRQLLERDATKRPTATKSVNHPLFWSKSKKLDLLTAVGNQPEIECPRAKRTPPLTEVEIDLETRFNTIVKYADWNDPGYEHMPAIYAEMARKRRRYDTHSVVELVRFIRNAIAYVSEDRRPTPIRKQILENFVFLEYFPDLLMEVYKAVTTHGWDQTREEVKFRHHEISMQERVIRKL